MPVVQSSVFNVLKRFPDRRDRVMGLFREREDFRAICEDYEKCLLSLRHWSGSEAQEAAARREEYAAMLDVLGAEIIRHLNETGQGERRIK